MAKYSHVQVPLEFVNDEDATLVRWLVENGSQVRVGQPIATLETAKAAFDVNAEVEGILVYAVEEHETREVGSTIAWICDEQLDPKELQKELEQSLQSEKKSDAGKVRVSGKAKLLMEKYGINASDFPGCNKIGVIDVENMLQRQEKVAQEILSSTSFQGQDNDDVEIIRLSNAKLYEAKELSIAMQGALSCTIARQMNTQKIGKVIEYYNEKGIRLSIGERLLWACSRTLKKFPFFNGYFSRDQFLHYKEVNIGYAIDLGKGLKVPVTQNVNQLSQIAVSARIKEFALVYMREKLTNADMAYGTFTVTDLTSFNVNHFTPLINHRQSATLGICAAIEGTLNLVLTFDHRVSEGRSAALFLAEIVKLAESVDEM